MALETCHILLVENDVGAVICADTAYYRVSASTLNGCSGLFSTKTNIITQTKEKIMKKKPIYHIQQSYHGNRLAQVFVG